jgi:hypothetical protein
MGVHFANPGCIHRQGEKRCLEANEQFCLATVQHPQMSKARRSTVALKPKAKSDWLEIVTALDRTMKSRITEEDGVEAKIRRAFSKPILTALNEAYAATLRYYAELLGGDIRNPKTEAMISASWKQAGRLLRHHDAKLSALLTARNGCWSQESTWSKATMQKAWLGLNSIRVSANLMAPDRTAEKWSKRH